ncbi:MAG: Vi polysaccharide biosynthesis protein VipB/TviC [Deltaproteobacteria bacterium RBG_19FT_COMBO_46_12]|nr:MAG: Vi polysaccharide biosynthesis protein VipB/TviC [Deltaproteobacteria bacterium RBG_19FT_COMBO_46_12]
MGRRISKVLVTGGAGFIGSHLTEALLQEGHRVRVLDDFSTGKRENLIFNKEYPSLEIIEGDIRHLAICQKAMKDIEYVFHQAALPSVQRSVEDPLGSNAVNGGGTLNILFAAREETVKRVIYASSSSIYGDTPTLPKHEEMLSHPLSPYALQKYIGEQYCRLFYQLYGLETVSLRYFNIFGPKQDPNSIYSAVIPKFIDALLQGSPPIIFGDGEQSRDFTYIGNVVQANLLAMSAEHLHGEAINIACAERTSLNQLVNLLRKILGSKLSPVYEEPRKGDVRHSLADIRKGKELLNYEPKVGVELGLKKTVEFFQKGPR